MNFHTFPFRFITIIVTVFFFLSLNSGCEKQDPADEPNETFEIIDIKSNNSKIIIGQRNIFSAILSDSTGNINYEWKVFFDDIQVGKTLSGYDLKSIKLNTSKVGEYKICLTVIRGVTDKSSFEKNFNSVESNFQYGCWGDNEETIKTAEMDNGYTIFQGLVGIPSVIPKMLPTGRSCLSMV